MTPKTRRRYVVQQGETLAGIAAALMHGEDRAVILYHHNKASIVLKEYQGMEYAVLEVGTVLMIPNEQRVQEFKKLKSVEKYYKGIQFGPVPDETVSAALRELDNTVQHGPMVQDDGATVRHATSAQEMLADSGSRYTSLSAAARVVELKNDEGYFATLEFNFRKHWLKIREYEQKESEILEHVYQYNSAKKKTCKLELTPTGFAELVKFEMWKQYIEEFLKG